MTYITPQDVKEAVAPDGDVIGTCGELDDEQLQRAIQRGQDRVDAATGRAFDDTNVPSLAKGLTLALAVFYATLAYRKSRDLAQFDPVYLMYQDAVNTLKDLSNNVIDITPVPDPGITDPTPGPRKPRVINPGVAANTQDALFFGLDDFGLGVGVSENGPRADSVYGGPS